MIAAKIDPETFLYVQLSDVLDDWAMLYKTFSGPFTGIRDLLAKLVLISTFSTCIFTEFSVTNALLLDIDHMLHLGYFCLSENPISVDLNGLCVLG